MNVTREVIYDLLPAYFAGDASDDTRALVDAYFQTDPEFARMASRFHAIVAERQRPGDVVEARERETFHCARMAAELPQKARASALGFGFASLFSFAMALLGFRNPGIILGVCFGVIAVVIFALSFRVTMHSWWRDMAGLDDERLRSLHTGRRSRRRIDV